jgi:hypothetical protein
MLAKSLTSTSRRKYLKPNKRRKERLTGERERERSGSFFFCLLFLILSLSLSFPLLLFSFFPVSFFFYSFIHQDTHTHTHTQQVPEREAERQRELTYSKGVDKITFPRGEGSDRAGCVGYIAADEASFLGW